ncbi:MAG: sulfotransferase [Candidatus Heimdallarchaeota archaeon]|nr:sulfotransferase [Candidatus Heimdallarchaeota archaeon]
MQLRYWPRAFLITFSVFFFLPFRLFEKLFSTRKIKKVKFNEPPIFILGHWRNGTTHLHNLMTQDERFAYFTIFRMVHPHVFLYWERIFRPFFKLVLPKSRPMDNMPLSFYGPQEEENGIANLCGLSINLACVFTSRRDNYLKYGSFVAATPKENDIWKKTYLNYLKKLALNKKGKRLLIKSPAMTQRIPMLLEMFPNAKFIHIRRDPYVTFFSIKQLYAKLFPTYYLQTPVGDEDAFILRIYNYTYRKFFSDYEMIPKENFIEVSFEDIEENPIREIQKIFQQLELQWTPEYEKQLSDYIDSIVNYEKNVYNITNEDREMIYSNCKEIIEKWGY